MFAYIVRRLLSAPLIVVQRSKRAPLGFSPQVSAHSVYPAKLAPR